MILGLIAGAVLVSSAAPPAETSGMGTSGGLPSTGSPEARRDALARYGAGVWQARRERLLSAAKAFEAAAKQDPEATAPLKELVRLYTEIGREPEAIRVARKILDKDPHDAETAHALARLLFDAGELKDAVAAAKLAADNADPATRPDKALAIYRDLATLLDRTGDPAGAAAILRKAVDLLTVNRKAVVATGTLSPKEIDAEAAETWERLGRALVTAGKPDDAADAFKAAHVLFAGRVNDPGGAARLDWNLSAALAAKGEPAAALKYLEAFLKRRPQALEPYERLAALLRQAGRGTDVVPALQKFARQDPENLPLLVVLATELARDPLTRRQSDTLFSQLYSETNDPKIVRAAIRSHVESGRAAQVIADLDQAYAALKGDEPNDAGKRAFAAEKARVIADALRAEKDWAVPVLRAAADDLRTGVKRAHQTWHLLGVLAARHGKLPLAVDQLQTALRNAPRDTEADAYEALLGVLWRSRRPAQVKTLCLDGLQNAQSVAAVFFNYHLALAHAELGDPDEAIAAADKAILQSGDVNRLVTRLRKVTVLNVLGKWDDAVTLCKKLLDEFDAPADQSRIRYALAGAYWGARKFTESEAELRAILDADPDHAGACNDLGYHLADQGRNLDEAERLVRHAVAVDRIDRRKAGDPEPDNAAYLDSLAWVLFRRGKLAEARDLFEKVSAMPDGAIDAVVWDHLGDVYFRLNEKPKAKAVWETAKDLYKTDRRGKQDGRLDEVDRKLKRIP